MLAIWLVLVVGTTIWVGVDAASRDFSQDKFADSTTKWVIGCIGLWIVAFPMYLERRGRTPLKSANGVPVAAPTWAAPVAVPAAPPAAPGPLFAASKPPPGDSAPGIEVDSKVCPDCAEDVRAEARKCRYCGYSFG